MTAWIPAQPIPVAMGPLAFAKPLSVFELVKNIDFNKFDTSYDKQVARTFQSKHVLIEDGPFAMGEVSFHHNLCFHTMVSGDWQKFLPGVEPGNIAASELNPVCWPVNTKTKV